MPTPRRVIVDESTPGLYHCISRCVRRAYLCGDGYEHRRRWMKQRIATLVELMAIDVFAYSILFNHFHMLLAIRPDIVAMWSDDEVADRYIRICPCKWKRRDKGIDPDGPPTDEEIANLISNPKKLATARMRLSNLSWFMAKIKEPIARRANVEDECTGRFWEGRFRSFAVLDPEAILAVAAYIDLNQVRAGMVQRPEDSGFTSLPERIKLIQSADYKPMIPLEPIPGFTDRQYLKFVDQSARVFSPGKQTMDAKLPPILERLGLTKRSWSRLLKKTWHRLNGTAIGTPDSLVKEAERRGGSWVCNPLHGGGEDRTPSLA
jgi:REP element-mobilizing transposase RayT